MKKLILLLLISQTVFIHQLFAQEAVESNADKGVRHEFVIANFRTESGVVLPQAHVVYGTYGKLNAAKDNVVLLPSHYMANFHGYEWLIGADKALEAVSCGDGVVWKWKFVFAEQYAGAISRAALPGYDNPRQRRGSTPAAYGRFEDHAFARDCRIFDGRAAGISVGRELRGFRGSYRGDFGNGEDVRTWNRAAGKRDCGVDDGSSVRERRLQGAAKERNRGVCDCMDGLAFLAGVVEEGDVAGGS
jgi:hypothetical protein